MELVAPVLSFLGLGGGAGAGAGALTGEALAGIGAPAAVASGIGATLPAVASSSLAGELGTLGAGLGAANAGVNLIKNLASTGGPATTSAAPKPTATSTITGTPIAPGTSPSDFTNSQNAYWKQLLSGLGIPGDQIPTNIQQDIAKQASLIGG